MKDIVMTPKERAENLLDDVQREGFDLPDEMLAILERVILDTEYDTLVNPSEVSERHTIE